MGLTTFAMRAWAKVRDVGKRHFTIMVVPHSERGIFSFQISSSILLFILLLAVLFILAAVNYQNKKVKMERELKREAAIHMQYWNLVKRYAAEIDRGDLAEKMQISAL